MADRRRYGSPEASGGKAAFQPLRASDCRAPSRIGGPTSRRSVLSEHLYFAVLNAGLAFVLMLFIWSTVGAVLHKTGAIAATMIATSPTP